MSNDTKTDNKPAHLNIGKGARFVLHQTFGTKRGDDMIALAEDGIPEAWDALKHGNFGPILNAIPDEHLPGLLKALIALGAGKP